MALDSIIRGSTSGTGAEVNAQNHLKVVTETDVATNPGNVGAVRIFSENDAGSVTGTPYLQAPETSDDYRLRVGLDSLLFDHTFSETTMDTSSVRLTGITNMSAALASGFLTLNSAANAVSATAFVSVATQRHFRIRATSPLYVELTGNLTAIPITNQVIETGLFVPTAGTQPQDGVWFQATSAGVIGVLAYNGTITQTGVLVTPGNLPIANNGTYLIVINTGYVEFWIDDVLFGEIEVPAGQATPFLTDSLPVTIMQRNSGVVAGAGQASLRMGDIGVTSGDIATNRSWGSQMASMGQMGQQGQAGGTMGSTASLPNATAATTVTGTALSQTAPIKAVATGGLGGEAGITAAVPGIDGMVFSYQNPVGGITQPPRNLSIMGMRVSAINIGAAVATTPSTVQWSLAFGATGATVPTLAQTEVNTLVAASVKGYRRVPLGFSSFLVGALVGTQAPDIVVKFDSPIVIYPGEWLALTAKFIQGTATANQVIWCTCMFDAHFD